MATVYMTLTPEGARFKASTFPQLKCINGTNYAVSGLFYDASLDEAAFWRFPATSYGSGNLTVSIFWYADTASSGDVVFGGALAAITPNSDSQDIETDGLDTEATATDTHLGTVGQRLHQIDVTVTALDSLAADDIVTLRIRRVGSSGSDTMTGDAALVLARVSYSDT